MSSWTWTIKDYYVHYHLFTFLHFPRPMIFISCPWSLCITVYSTVFFFLQFWRAEFDVSIISSKSEYKLTRIKANTGSTLTFHSVYLIIYKRSIVPCNFCFICFPVIYARILYLGWNPLHCIYLLSPYCRSQPQSYEKHLPPKKSILAVHPRPQLHKAPNSS